MTGALVLVERNGTREIVDMTMPDPPESDSIVKTAYTWLREYRFTCYDEAGRPVYQA